LSIARIFPKNHTCRRFSFGLSIAFFLNYAAILLIGALGCKPGQGAWYDLNYNTANCLKDQGTRSLALSSALEFVSDILLVAFPLVMLWKIKLPTKERRLILALFSSSSVSLLSCIAFTVAWYLTVGNGMDTLILASMFSLLQVS